MNRKVSIACVQTAPTEDRDANLRNALALADEAFEMHAYVDALVLPEYFCRVVPRREADSVAHYPEDIIEELSRRARKHSSYIIAGTAANRKADGKVYNTALVFDRSGDVAGEYSKIHMFDALNAMGGTKESDTVTRGDSVFVHDADFGRIGVMICYDIRFPELARAMALKGVQYMFVPAAFYSPRADHWHDLIRATALQNSMHVAGANLFGKLNDRNVFCGRSLIADPWGVAVATASDKPCVIQSYVDSGYAEAVRDSIGTFHNRVPEMYG